MPTFSQLPSGKWRVQVRKAGLYRAATFPTKRDARTWATAIEAQAAHVAAGGFAPPPKDATYSKLARSIAASGATSPPRRGRTREKRNTPEHRLTVTR